MPAFGSQATAVVIDLTGVAFPGSRGLALPAEAAAHADRRGVRLVPAAGHRAVVHPIHVTALDDVFDLYQDVDRAVAAVAAPPATPSPSRSRREDV
ncbi:STAS domain-containing protein [Saccharothrix sp. NPDC042600]|uniref:STAS domain-containing protein n=1 Tax=Saccharothrix TaxID=2071 RepID=UPI0033C54632